MLSRLLLCALACTVAACDPRVCTDEEGRTHELPARLSQTGLFADLPGEGLASGVFTYSPQFVLWSDGADKRRFIALPEGAHIDNSDAETWEFPEGTKLWKEFSREDRHLETRLLQKTGPGEADWAAAAYIWRADQSDADLAPYGALDVLGTAHDVPASGECFGCHGGRSNLILGFSAVQLSPRSYEESPHLNDTAERALLAAPMTTLDVPGTATERDALGYLHANCSHCHNQSDSARASGKCLNPNQRLSFDLDFTLHVGELDSVEETATYRTALGKVVERGNPGASKVVQLMGKRDGGLAQMPPLGTKSVDDHGLELIRAWVRTL